MAEENVMKVFKSFTDDIIKVFPEYEKRINKYYKASIEKDDPTDQKIIDFLDNIEEISDKISDKDTKLFDEDPVILQNVSFKTIWNSDISNQTRLDIWKYLQTFCIIKINLDSSKEKMNEVLKKIETKEKIKDKKTFNNIKKLKKLNESIDIDEVQKIISENPESLNQGIDQMESMFENTNIGKIAKEITDDLDIEGMLDKDGGIENLFSGGNMMNIIQSISSKMEDQIDPENSSGLMEEATNICGSMQGNPLFSSLFNNMTNSMGGNPMGGNPMGGNPMGGNPIPAKEQETKNINVSDPKHDPNKTRQRLQNKLEEKKKLNIEKKD